MMEWQPIETAPRDGTEIIAYMSGEYHPDVISVCYCPEDEDGPGGWYDNYGVDYHPDFWMPLPEIPKKRHWCQAMEGFYCRTNELGRMTIGKDETEVFCIVCPFCGEAADKKPEPAVGG